MCIYLQEPETEPARFIHRPDQHHLVLLGRLTAVAAVSIGTKHDSPNLVTSGIATAEFSAVEYQYPARSGTYQHAANGVLVGKHVAEMGEFV